MLQSRSRRRLRLRPFRSLQLPQDVDRDDDALASHALAHAVQLSALFLLEIVQSNRILRKSGLGLHVQERLESNVAVGVVALVCVQKIGVRVG